MNSSPLIYRRSESLCKTLELKIPSMSQTVGRLGELLVYKLFRDRSIIFYPSSFFCSYSLCDFKIWKGTKIEVKCAYPNEEGKCSFIISKNKGKFDILICVILNHNIFNKPKFYIIPKKDISHLQGFHITDGNKKKFKKYLNNFKLIDKET